MLHDFRRFFLERLEDRSNPSVVPTWELTEGNASSWTTFASDSRQTSIVDDMTTVASGNASLRFDTKSGFDTGVRLVSGSDTWDVTSFKQLAFWTFSVNDTPIGFQGNQPVLVLKSANGSYVYTPSSQEMPNQGWQRHHVPLAGDAIWQRQTVGTPDFANITEIEIHQDTWDYGFTVYYDGMQFSTHRIDESPAAGPLAPPGVTPGNVAPKMLLYIFDPIMENHGGKRLHEVYGWSDPVQLTKDALADFAASSHGMYTPQITQTVIVNAHPYFVDGFQHTDASFDTAWAAHDFHDAMFDYSRFIADNNLSSRVDAGEIDEVWIYAPPINGTFESVMAGNGAYWINGPAQAAGERVFPIMGLNYERGVGEAIHSFGHRAEGTMDHAYESLSGDLNNNWRRFTRIDRDAPGAGGVGNVHFPVNGQGDYDYDNTLVVSSNADDWANYPNFTGSRRSFNSSEWTPTHQDSQRDYLNWWYAHMPHFSGRAPDGRLSNWWRYLGDLDAFKTNGDLYGADGTGRAWLTGVSPGQQVSGMKMITGQTLLDGVAGRVDLYVNGVYHSSDTIGPFTFSWNTSGLARGQYTLEVRAYDVQNGTETRSNGVTVNVGTVNRAPTGIALSGTSIAENNAPKAEVGTLSTIDPDGETAFTYALVTGSGSTDNKSFTISGSQLKLIPITNFETKSSYSIRVRSTDQGGLFVEKVMTVTVTNVNEPPSGIGLSKGSIAENNAVNAVVGTLSTVDPDAGASFTYTLAGGTGSTDNKSFTISGSQLKLTPVANFEAKSSYSIRVRSIDQGGLYFEKTLTVTVANVNEVPTDMGLSKSSIAENNPAKAVVGTFSTADPDAGATFTYVLVGGAGSTDNKSFAINGGQLKLTPIANFEAKSRYAIRVRSTDQGGLFFEKTFIVLVTNVNEAPSAIGLSSASIAENNAVNAVVGILSTTDPDAGATFTYTLVGGTGSTDNKSLTISGSQLKLAPVANFEAKKNYSIRVRSTDQGGLFTEKTLTVAVTNVNEAPTSIGLSKVSIAENNAVNALVGVLSATDPDVGSTFTYSFVSEAGSNDNKSFTVSGNQLRAAVPFDFETKSRYTIVVRATDSLGLFVDRSFVIMISDVAGR